MSDDKPHPDEPSPKRVYTQTKRGAPPWSKAHGISKNMIWKRFKINRWEWRNMLSEKAGCKREKHHGKLLNFEEAKRLIEACAEFVGTRGLKRYGSDLLTYGHKVWRQREHDIRTGKRARKRAKRQSKG